MESILNWPEKIWILYVLCHVYAKMINLQRTFSLNIELSETCTIPRGIDTKSKRRAIPIAVQQRISNKEKKNNENNY